MVQFAVNTTRIDPYKNFKFRVTVDQQIVAGVSKVSGLKRTTEVVTHRNSGQRAMKLHSPGVTNFEPITLDAASPTTRLSKPGRKPCSMSSATPACH